MKKMLFAFIVLLSSACYGVEVVDFSKGGVFTLGEGVYEIADTVAPPVTKGLTIKGIGPKTIIRLTKDLVDNEGKPQPMFYLAGRVNADGKRQGFNVQLSELTIDGGHFRCEGLSIFNGGLSYLDHVTVQNCNGTGIRLKVSWDLIANDVQVIRSATPTEPAVVHEDYTPEYKDGKLLPPYSGNVNNIKWMACRFENNNGPQVYCGAGSTKLFFIGTKWHGQLPTPGLYDHLIFAKGSFASVVTGCNFANGGANAITLKGDGMAITSNIIGNSDGYGVLDSGESNIVLGNIFPGKWDNKNLKGNYLKVAK